jgi:hypothetical protein
MSCLSALVFLSVCLVGNSIVISKGRGVHIRVAGCDMGTKERGLLESSSLLPLVAAGALGVNLQDRTLACLSVDLDTK